MKFPLGKEIAVLILYVNNIILIGEFEEEILRLKKLSAKDFETKDFEHLKDFVGMEVAWSKKGISVSQ